MSWVRIWVHLVFSTKNREPFLISKEIRDKIFAHARQNAREKNIRLNSINGFKDHVQCLICLNREQSISKTAQLIKGELAYWINKNHLIRNKFIWQDDYWAVGISESHVGYLRKYIAGQEEHHKKNNFNLEINKIMRKYYPEES